MHDVVVIGGGPAGLTAALYAGRAKLKTRVVEKHALGGQTLLTESIENFPGVYNTKVFAWLETIKKQLADLKDVEITEEAKVDKIERDLDILKVHVTQEADRRKETLESHTVIVATGGSPRKLGIKGEDAFIGRGVSYCGTCDGPLFKNKEIALIGGGETALEEALYLRRFAKKITLIHRRNALRASALLQERVRADEKIQLQLESVPVEVIGKTRVEAIKIKNVNTLSEGLIHCEGVFVFVGSDPDTEFLKGFIDVNEAGYCLTDENMATNVKGVFACGDCRLRPFKQVVTACSEGAIAAYSAVKFMECRA